MIIHRIQSEYKYVLFTKVVGENVTKKSCETKLYGHNCKLIIHIFIKY